MIIAVIAGATRVLGQSQGFRGLPIRDQVTPIYPRLPDVAPSEAEPLPETAPVLHIREMVSAWQPTPAELEALNNGASIYVHVQGDIHPPIKVEVGPPV